MITILISTEEYDLVSLRSTVRRRVKRFGGKPVKVMGRGGGGVNLFSFKLGQLTKEIGDKIEMGRNLQTHGVSFMSFSCKSTFLYGNNSFLSFKELIRQFVCVPVLQKNLCLSVK